MHTIDSSHTTTDRGATRGLLAAAAVGAAVSVSLGVYATTHEPTGQGIATLGFPAVLPMKAWLTTGAFVLALGQAVSAAWMWGRLPGVGAAPAWLGAAHRWTGTAAFLVSLPVAYHCLWALGFQSATPRVLLHSLFGLAFYGALATKLVVLRVDGAPRWALPVAGASLALLLTAIWLTSSLWFFTTVGFPGV